MIYPKRNKHCPVRATCYDYHDRACDTCEWGQEFHRLHKRIALLKQKLKDLEGKEHDKDADKIG